MCKLILPALCLAGLVAGCSRSEVHAPARPLRVFHAAGMTPVLDTVRHDCRSDLGIELLTEGSGSQVACRKLTELGRSADLLILADSALVSELLSGVCSWRLDFACDEVVLGVGKRAPDVSAAEDDWVSVLLRDDVRVGRVDENQGPSGYRTLLVWKLEELRSGRSLYDRLLAKSDKVVDDVSRLAALLRAGEVDYGFVYRSICIAMDMRYIELDPQVNLGSQDVDYSRATVAFEKLKSGAKETVTVRGEPSAWTLAIPDRGADEAAAGDFVRWFLAKKADVIARNGLRQVSPALFYGAREKFPPFESVARYAGDLR
ncbi:MAG: substrate-binding domain-containing protein [Planctomycetota bacterium]